MAVDTTWTDPSTSGAIDLSTGGIVTETIWDKILSNLKRLGGTAGLLQTTDAGLLLLNETSNANMTIGLTIMQGANDDEVYAAKSSDVAHGLTGVAETDTYFHVKKAAADQGGALMRGFADSGGYAGLALVGVNASTVTATKSTSADGYVRLDGATSNGVNLGDCAAEQNLVVIRNNTTTRFIFDADGDSHQDVGTAWTNFDDYEDVALLTALSVGVSAEHDPIRAQFGRLLDEHRETLEKARLVTFNMDGHHFVNWSRTNMLTIGAVRQLFEMFTGAMDRLCCLEAQFKMITEKGA